MYVQQKFQETRLDVLHALIRAQPLGAIVTLHGVLRAHMPRSNPLWQETTGSEAPADFIGKYNDEQIPR